MSGSEEPKPTPPSQNWKTAEEAVAELPAGKGIWAFFFHEGKAVKNGWVAVLIMVCLAFLGGSTWRKSKDDVATKTTEQAHQNLLNERDNRIHALERERDDVVRERDKAQLDLAPWKTYADIHNKDAPPDQRLDLLLNEVRALGTRLPPGSRHLTAEQHDRLVSELKQYPPFSITVRFAALNSEILDYAEEIKAALKEGGWIVHDAKPLLMMREGKGIELLVKDPAHPPKTAQFFYDTLKAVGISAAGVKMEDFDDHQFELYIGYQ